MLVLKTLKLRSVGLAPHMQPVQVPLPQLGSGISDYAALGWVSQPSYSGTNGVLPLSARQRDPRPQHQIAKYLFRLGQCGQQQYLGGLHTGKAAHLLKVLRLPVRSVDGLLLRLQLAGQMRRGEAAPLPVEPPRLRLQPRERRLRVIAPNSQRRLRSGQVPAALQLGRRSRLLTP